MRAHQLTPLVALLILLISLSWVADSKSDKNDSDKDKKDKEDKGKGGVDKYYRKKDLQRITELLAEVSELQTYLERERTFLTDLLISALSMPKPDVHPVQDFKNETRSLSKKLEKFFQHNTLTGRPQKSIARHVSRYHSAPVEENSA